MGARDLRRSLEGRPRSAYNGSKIVFNFITWRLRKTIYLKKMSE
jgi:hypothetical protein